LLPWNKGSGCYISGRAKIELPQYRVRGVFRAVYSPKGELRIDFKHSSLFGAYREDATILVKDSTLAILDRERGRIFAGDSSLIAVRNGLGIAIRPDDIIYAFMLAFPSCADFDPFAMSGSGREWGMSGRWRGRTVELKGEKGEGPSSFKQCVDNGRDCYTINYDYAGSSKRGGYPGWMVLNRERGTERISLEIREFKEFEPPPSSFKLEAME
jgi:hypothetical protein